MAITTKDIALDNIADAEELTLTLKDATTFYKNSFVAKAAAGTMKPFDGTSGDILLGRLIRADNGGFTAAGIPYTGKGDNSLTSFGGTSGRPTGCAKLGAERIPNVTITGLASAADIGKAVYLNADDQTFTLTPPATNTQQIGVVTNWVTSTTGELLVLPFVVRQGLNSGENDQWVHIASAPTGATGALGVAASDFGLNLPAPFHGLIIDCFAMNNGAALTGGPVTVNPSIAGVTTTGGNMVLTVTLGAKTRIAGTAITAANEFHKGDNLSLITSTVTSFTAGGPVDFFIKLRRLAGA